MSDSVHVLTVRNRRLLREVVRRVHLRHFPVERITDLECDRVIAAIAPVALEAMLRAAVDSGLARG